MTLVVVIGEPGGKSRLPETLARAARLGGYTVAVVRVLREAEAPLVVVDEFLSVDKNASVISASTFAPPEQQEARPAWPPSVPWWSVHRVPITIPATAACDSLEPRCGAPRSPGRTGKRTTASQKLHNRRAA